MMSQDVDRSPQSDDGASQAGEHDEEPDAEGPDTEVASQADNPGESFTSEASLAMGRLALAVPIVIAAITSLARCSDPKLSVLATSAPAVVLGIFALDGVYGIAPKVRDAWDTSDGESQAGEVPSSVASASGGTYGQSEGRTM